MQYLNLPLRLFHLLRDKGSEITGSHVVLYGSLLEHKKRGTNPVETHNLSIHEIMDILGWKKVYFYRVLDDLIKHEFIERVYDVGQKRSSLLKIRFLPDP